jgi:hypothetical protein
VILGSTATVHCPPVRHMWTTSTAGDSIKISAMIAAISRRRQQPVDQRLNDRLPRHPLPPLIRNTLYGPLTRASRVR